MWLWIMACTEAVKLLLLLSDGEKHQLIPDGELTPDLQSLRENIRHLRLKGFAVTDGSSTQLNEKGMAYAAIGGFASDMIVGDKQIIYKYLSECGNGFVSGNDIKRATGMNMRAIHSTLNEIDNSYIRFSDCSTPNSFNVRVWEDGHEYFARAFEIGMYGEIEKKLPITTTMHITDNSFNNNGNIAIGNDNNQLRADNALKSPITQTKKSIQEAPPKKSLIEKLSWIFGILAASIAMYEFVIKRFLDNK